MPTSDNCDWCQQGHAKKNIAEKKYCAKKILRQKNIAPKTKQIQTIHATKILKKSSQKMHKNCISTLYLEKFMLKCTCRNWT